MTKVRSLLPFLLVSVLALTACERDDKTSANESTDPTGVGFLLFPNPQVQQDGTYQTNTTAYAQAYYTAIDPTSTKSTLTGWRTANGFGSGTGTEFTVIFRDVHDLGYGRRMTARRNLDGTVAVMVENYQVTAIPGQPYGPLNLEAAISRDSRWHVGTNAIEFSSAPNGQTFAKFFNFSPTTGERQLTADLDGRGQKAMPGICVACHGGRADPLNADGSFPNGGNMRARLQPLNVGSFDFAPVAGYTRADQEANLKQLNQFVLCTYPLDSATVPPVVAPAEDVCRPIATGPEWANQWQSTAAEMLKSWYGGAGMTSPTFSDTYVPAGWAGQETLYNAVVAPYCRTCHILRGSGSNQSDIDFMSYAEFQSYADRIKAHVFDRGNMPLAFLVAQRFWGSSAPDTLATFLEGQGQTARDANGTVLRPGRPIANPGVDRIIPPGSVTLSASNSLFANSYSWSITSGPATATLANANTATPTLTVPNTNGAYVLQLVASNGSTTSSPAQLTLTVDNTFPIAPSAIRFSDIRNAFQSTPPWSTPCTGCHTDVLSSGAAGTPPWEPSAFTPPIFYTNYNRGGTPGTAGDPTFTADSTDDDYWFYVMLRGRINLTDPAASPLLRKPVGFHHGGGAMLLNTSHEYSLFANWIMNGAPYN